MWNEKKSVKLTYYLVKIFYVILFVVAIIGILVFCGKAKNFYIDEKILKNMFIDFYLCAPAGLITLICLDKLLTNIRHDEVFITTNVTLMRIISWCCFYVAGISAVFTVVYLYITFVIVTVAALFVGLIVRVVKNVFAAAEELKEENDLTV